LLLNCVIHDVGDVNQKTWSLRTQLVFPMWILIGSAPEYRISFQPEECKGYWVHCL